MKDEAVNSVEDAMELTVNEPSGSEYGQIFINNSVIAVIAHETAKKVPGVVELQGSLADDLAGIIGKKSKDKGIRIEKAGEELIAIDLAVVLEFGIRIPEICVQLQTEVKQAVEEMTGKHVSAVNVVVQGIRNPAEKKSEE
ncbi:MAG: Asp23/Gls24 family envelope stress response protein [Pontiellaceae bacterium]|nr:Asp23/Gls24 family envelope stress response protein [Pontiellaceae bacterium]MBN2785741.1 Asp23/Gls24 family envelope stress response protein [Pontiellaceae bacterium]